MGVKLEPHEWLREQREDRKIRQSDIESLTAKMGSKSRISQSHLSKIEKGHSALIGLGAERMDALRKALGLTPEEWLSGTGIQIVTEVPSYDRKLSPVPSLHRVPVIGLAAAGAPVTDEEDSRIIGWEYPADTEYRPHMLCLEVDGESMNDGAADGMRHGDRLYVDPHDMQLQEGKVYVVHLHGNGIVVKRARKLGTDWWLFSDNSDYKPTRPDEATVIGRVYYHQPRGKRL